MARVPWERRQGRAGEVPRWCTVVGHWIEAERRGHGGRIVLAGQRRTTRQTGGVREAEIEGEGGGLLGWAGGGTARGWARSGEGWAESGPS